MSGFLAGKNGVLEFVDNFSQFGKGKEKRFTPPKMSSKHDDLQAFDTKGWDGHSIDSGPSLGQGQATGRVDISVDAVERATVLMLPLLHRSPQCVVLVNPGSHVEKKEKTVFVKGVEGKTRVRRVVDSTQIWELLDDGIDMWAAVNGKRVDMHDTPGGAQRFRQPPQDIPGQWTCFVCGQ